MKRTRGLSLWVVAATALACAGDGATVPRDRTTLAVAPNDAQANGTVRGQVLGVVIGGGTEPVASAGVEVYYLEPDPSAPPDTTGWYIRHHMGTVVSGADGRFELTSVPEGEYILVVNPPEPYTPGDEWSMTSPGTGVLDVTLVLGRSIPNP